MQGLTLQVLTPSQGQLPAITIKIQSYWLSRKLEIFNQTVQPMAIFQDVSKTNSIELKGRY